MTPTLKGVVNMETVSKNNAIVWGFVAVAILVNIAGYLWDLYEQIRLFDEFSMPLPPFH